MARERKLIDKYGGLFIGISVACTVWLLSSLNVLTFLQGTTYDLFSRLSTHVRHKPSNVLLIEVDQDDLTDGGFALSKMLNSVENLGARQVIFNFLPRDVPVDFYQQAAYYGNVIFGRRLRVQTDNPQVLNLTPIPAVADGQKLVYGIVSMSPKGQWGSRKQSTTFSIEGETYEALEVVAAKRVSEKQTALIQSNQYFVDFRRSESMPTMSLQYALEKGLVPEVVEGKDVIVGLSMNETMTGFHAPTTGRQTMSLLEYQGHSLSTLIMGKHIKVLPAVPNVVVLILLALLSIVVYQSSGTRFTFRFTFVMILMYTTISVIGFVYLNWWFPVVETTLTQFILLVIVLKRRSLFAESEFKRWLLDLSDESQKDFPSKQQHWDEVDSMVYQTLSVNQMAFLDALEGTHFLCAIHGQHSTPESLIEQRRDYRHYPYSAALDEQGPICVENFLKSTGVYERQYLIPLMDESNVLGFWAVSVHLHDNSGEKQLKATLSSYGQTISEWVSKGKREIRELYKNNLSSYSRGSGIKERIKELFKDKAERLMSYATTERQQVLCNRIGRILGSMRADLCRMEGILGDASTAVIAYNPSGERIYVNTQMKELLRKEEFAYLKEGKTALDLVSSLPGFSLDEARTLLRRVAIEKESVPLAAALESKGRRTYQLNLRPLIPQEISVFPKLSASLGFNGIVCELEDTTATTRLIQLKETVDTQLRNDLGVIRFSAFLLGNKKLSDKEREETTQTLDDKVEEIAKLFKNSQEFFSTDAETFEKNGRIPVNALATLHAALENLKPLAEGRRVTFKISHEPKLMHDVYASPDRLEHTFQAILGLLVQDAVHETEIRVAVEENTEKAIFSFANTGIGMPNERFWKYLNPSSEQGSPERGSDELERLREAQEWVQHWGGSMEAESQFSEGFRFTLHLDRFI